MFNISYVTGIKEYDGNIVPLDQLGTTILLKPEAYNDAVHKMAMVVVSRQELVMRNNDEITESQDFWNTVTPLVDKIVLSLGLQIPGDNTKARFIDLINRVNQMWNFIYDFEDDCLEKLANAGDLVVGIKIIDDNGDAVYSFDARDREEFGGRRRKKHE